MAEDWCGICGYRTQTTSTDWLERGTKRSGYENQNIIKNTRAVCRSWK